MIVTYPMVLFGLKLDKVKSVLVSSWNIIFKYLIILIPYVLKSIRETEMFDFSSMKSIVFC